MYSLKKLREGVYILHFDNPYELAMTFMRYQEFYESINDRFRENSFTWAQLMSWYVKQYNNDSLRFNYAEDWEGFNLPANVIKQVWDKGIPDENHYDRFMMSVYETIMSEENHQGQNSYLIGVSGDVIKDANNAETLAHELAHAMWQLDEDYRKGCSEIIGDVGWWRGPTGKSYPYESEALYPQLKQVFLEEGYPEKTLDDEIQAYLTTGENPWTKKIKSKQMNVLRKRLKTLYKKHIKEFLKNTVPYTNG